MLPTQIAAESDTLFLPELFWYQMGFHYPSYAWMESHWVLAGPHLYLQHNLWLLRISP